MRIAVIGAGNIGGTIGPKWAEAGHDVVYGLRDPSKRPDALPIASALDGAEAVLLALPAAAVVDFVRAHATALDGRILIDATNNFGGPKFNAFSQLQAAVPQAQLFRAFNTVGWDVFAGPTIGGLQADLFYCGPDGAPGKAVERLISDVGLRPIRIGGTDLADTVDGLLPIWFTLSQRLGRRIAFKLLSEAPPA